jgi:hypothetical protein
VLTSELVAAFKDAARRASWSRRLNIPVDCDRDHSDLILAPEVIDETNFVQDGVILDPAEAELAYRCAGEIGTPAPPKLSDKGARAAGRTGRPETTWRAG